MTTDAGTLKNYDVGNNIGYCKYTVCYHNGVDTHKDGSPFYNIRIFSNKKKLAKFIKELTNSGYIERGLRI